MSDISEIISSNQMNFNCISVETNPFMPHDREDMKHFLCTFTGDRIDHFEFYVSIDTEDANVMPDAEMALSLLIEDVRLYKNCDGYEDFARILGVEDAEDDSSIRIAFEEISRYATFADSLNLPAIAPSAGI